MRIQTKLIFLIIFLLILSVISYSIYLFIELIWFLIPTGLLSIGILLFKIFKIKNSNFNRKYHHKDELLKFTWVYWSLMASIFITFFNNYIGNIIWCTLTLSLIYMEIKAKKKIYK